MIYHMPKFYYSGSKKWGIESDVLFIKSKLQRLNKANQKIVSEQYEEIYKHHFNLKEWRLARFNANQMLSDFANENGITLQEYQKISAANDDQEWIDSQIEHLKLAQKVAKPRINLGERKRA